MGQTAFLADGSSLGQGGVLGGRSKIHAAVVRLAPRR
jgi:hypothetical protein